MVISYFNNAPGVHDDSTLGGFHVGRVPETSVVEGQNVVTQASDELARGDP